MVLVLPISPESCDRAQTAAQIRRVTIALSMRKILLPLAAAALLLPAQTAQKFALTVDNIMRGPGLVGYEPAQVRWSGDGARIFFQWKQASQKEDAPMDTYQVGRDGSGLRKLSDEEAKAAPPALGEPSLDHSRTV